MLGINNYLACFGMIVYAFGSSLFPYSVSISAHPFSSLSLIAVIWLSLKVLRDENAFWCMFTQYFIFGDKFIHRLSECRFVAVGGGGGDLAARVAFFKSGENNFYFITNAIGGGDGGAGGSFVAVYNYQRQFLR